MRTVSLERYYFVLYDRALTLKMSKMVLNLFCDKTLHMYFSNLDPQCMKPKLEALVSKGFLHNTAKTILTFQIANYHLTEFMCLI